ncbi:hypothetical protein QBC37DRAFT_379190 [Rhypophila decipiens]|uniref:Uncharacterized protein n=1 Tax=Rhypophila decipiens TaxID=261697 RepID=A0AAN6XX72_9PEZI|nr:hypothetical protein QBC37DRAFT_379190 [Rhypophila decipiens]
MCWPSDDSDMPDNMSDNAMPDNPYTRKPTPEQVLRRAFFDEQLNGRTHLDGSSFEYALQAFTNCLHMCETNPSLADLKYEVLGNIGWVNRLMGRYTMAVQYLKEALALADSLPGSTNDKKNVLIEAELGTVYRLTDRHEEARATFSRLYTLANKMRVEHQDDYHKAYYWKRVVCRAAGNLGMANYQRALQILVEAEDLEVTNPKSETKEKEIKQMAKDLLHQAMSQLRERLKFAEDIADAESGGHGGSSRNLQAICWQCIAYSRLSLCHTALADLNTSTESKKHHLKNAIDYARKGVDLAYWKSVISLSRFFYGRALLRWSEMQASLGEVDTETAEKDRTLALEQFGSEAKYLPSPETVPPYEVATAAIALAMEPCTEHREYLKELVDAGADFEATDLKSGYTALDYAIFSGDTEAEEIIITGLRKQYRARTGRNMSGKQVENLKAQSRLRKGYREIFQEVFRPELMRGYEAVEGWKHDEETLAKNRVVRRQALRGLRRMYSRALAEETGMEGMFDPFKVISYQDFVQFGRLPRSSDGLARPFEASTGNDEGGDDGEFVVFFSYRWINNDGSLDSPDDKDRTQYKRMVDAIEAYLERKKGFVSREKLFIWMDFACVDQDNPAAGVASLPLVIAQCDAVITLHDETYFDRAWCCVEASMIQTLRTGYELHEWLEQVPYGTNDDDGRDADSDAGDKTKADGIEIGSTENKDDDAPEWRLRKRTYIYLRMVDKKLSYETDRPKVLFLERQTSLLERVRRVNSEPEW